MGSGPILVSPAHLSVGQEAQGAYSEAMAGSPGCRSLPGIALSYNSLAMHKSKCNSFIPHNNSRGTAVFLVLWMSNQLWVIQLESGAGFTLISPAVGCVCAWALCRPLGCAV